MARIPTIYYLLYWGEAVPTSVTQAGNEIASDLVETHRRMMPGEEMEPKTSQRRTLLRRNISYLQTTDRGGRGSQNAHWRRGARA
jgi:hypothetical protein